MPMPRLEPVHNRCTTIILRGLNRQITREMVVALVDDTSPEWHTAQYDYIYVPWTADGSCNIGLAFVNFVSPSSCQEYIKSLLHSRNRGRLSIYHVRSVGPAAVQGRGDNLRAMILKRGHKALEGADAPLVFQAGQRMLLQQAVFEEVPAGILAAAFAASPDEPQTQEPSIPWPGEVWSHGAPATSSMGQMNQASAGQLPWHFPGVAEPSSSVLQAFPTGMGCALQQPCGAVGCAGCARHTRMCRSEHQAQTQPPRVLQPVSKLTFDL
ncbi:unnamed protein product [Effrenium voratum]|uniref:Mei2-like C-terminal RNA recognition motif domain-containing protein n=1 Tax=Effrenium voratum TaxID=2562239 RepID=A0AA36MTH2_9DINO|nr:unnamed protein product [Effrenium voratum]